MKLVLFLFAALLLIKSPNTATADEYLNNDALLGAILGAAIGYQIDEHDGAVIGSVVGTLAGSSLERHYRKRAKNYQRLEFALLRDQRLRENTARRLNQESLNVRLSGDEAFELGKAKLNPDAHSSLTPVVQHLKQYPRTIVYVIGHTDSEGLPYPNTVLSLARAQAVATYFMLNGVDRSRMVVEGMGEEQPVVTNDSEENRQTNRRVEISVAPIFSVNKIIGN